MSLGKCNVRLATLVERLAATLWIALILALASIGVCHAHATLVMSNPSANSILDDYPQQFSLEFSEPVSSIFFSLVEPDGTIQNLESIEAAGNMVTLHAPDIRQRGTHALNWRVVSADGHPIGGSIVYSIGAPTAAIHPEGPKTDSEVRDLIWLARLLIYAGCFFGVGGIFFFNWMETDHHDKRDPVLLAVLLPGLAAAAFSIPLQGLDVLSLPIGTFSKNSAWNAGFATTYGTSALFAGSAICLALFAHLFKIRVRLLSAIALIAVGLAFGSSGHAVTAAPQWLMRSAVIIHVMSAAFWAGSLYPLAKLFATGCASAPSVLRRFSRTVLFAVIPMLVAGVVLAFVQLGRVDALWLTDYGRVLVGKSLLVGVVLICAAVNRVIFTSPAVRGDLVAGRNLRTTTHAEILLILGILAVVGLWRFTPPPRTVMAEPVAAAEVHIHTEKVMVDLSLTPKRIGAMTAQMSVTTGDFAALHEKEVTLVMSHPTLGIASLKRRAVKIGEGLWRVENLNVPFPGDWLIRLDVLVSDFDLVKLQATVHIGSKVAPS
ncbi:copper resistance protein CopC [Phyllobacterium brassicacearum]|uniref:Copper resistance protein CopC n=1 Tax=Phyllobacterium brassicacearum TaxID=314235 RepID=A0A2P7B6C1_9HYPH|nr:CopD family protein [Phyllobacterium brassicacearum]PSH62012.1 copper resistance protein CopC [Phyllobacterium brassicacearum]TDQ14914.1 copper transport protein [Phyllobacterium brassicacearum]